MLFQTLFQIYIVGMLYHENGIIPLIEAYSLKRHYASSENRCLSNMFKDSCKEAEGLVSYCSSRCVGPVVVILSAIM